MILALRSLLTFRTRPVPVPVYRPPNLVPVLSAQLGELIEDREAVRLGVIRVLESEVRPC